MDEKSELKINSDLRRYNTFYEHFDSKIDEMPMEIKNATLILLREIRKHERVTIDTIDRIVAGLMRESLKRYIKETNRQPKWWSKRFPPIAGNLIYDLPSEIVDHWDWLRLKKYEYDREYYYPLSYIHGLRFSEEKILSLQPYQPVTMETLKKLYDVCIEKNLRYFILADSTHFPGRTIRILISPKERVI